MSTDLAAWLLEQIAEDRQAALAALRGYDDQPWMDCYNPEPRPADTERWTAKYHEVRQVDRLAPGPGRKKRLVADCGPANVYPAAHIRRWEPARVLAECEAKRRIIEANRPGRPECDDLGNYTGMADRQCGDHRTTGQRAWCHDCSEWCYPTSPCVRCPNSAPTVLSLMSLPYADRPGYLAEWAPE